VTTPTRSTSFRPRSDELTAPGVLGEFGIPARPHSLHVGVAAGRAQLSRQGRDEVPSGGRRDCCSSRRVSDGDKIEVLVNRGEHGRDINREAIQRELDTADAELAKNQDAKSSAELRPMQDIGARLGRGTAVKPATVHISS